MNTTPSTSQSPARRLFNRRTVTAFSIIGLAAVGYFGWRKWVPAHDSIDQYQIASVQRGDVEDLVTATGTLQPREYVDIGAQVSGQLKKIHVEIGSVVSAGTLLAEIDPTVYRANVEARRASLRNQQATLLDRQAQLALAELQYKRQKNLMEGDATTTESVQAAEASLNSAKAQLQALQAQIEQTESTLLADEANLNYAKIYAPMAGVVVSISARQGQTLNTNQSAPIILRIADLSTMTVQTQVSEADVSRLSPNMEAYFTTLGNRGKRWYGQLRKLEPTPTVTNNVVLYNALFDVPNEQRNLLPQMTAQVFFVAASAKDALYIPAAAVAKQASGPRNPSSNSGAKPSEKSVGEKNSPEKLHTRREQSEKNSAHKNADTTFTEGQIWAGVAAQPRRDGGEATIKVVNADGDIEERTIKIGISNRVHVQVLAGLNEGDQVVVGRKPPPGAESAQSNRSNSQDSQQRNALQGNMPGGPGMGGPR
ncbi:MAG: efflux RND transporter periplasmic adaptor subunit [Spongiibacteraceae bacterium]